MTKTLAKRFFGKKHPHHGIIFLRLSDDRANNKIDVLRRLLESYADKLPDQFVVATETRVRFARKSG